MNRTKRQERRLLAEARKAQRREPVEALAASEAELAKALARPDLHRRGRADRAIRRACGDGPVPAFFRVIAERAPRLLEGEYVRALRVAARLPAARPIDAWEPRAKGRERLFRSLFLHLFCDYAIAPCFQGGLFDEDGPRLGDMIVWVASGGSLFEYAKSRGPIALTRRECHIVASESAERSLVRAIRLAQVRAVSGSERLAQAWAGAPALRRLYATREDEAFFGSAAEWLVTRGAKDYVSQVAPLLDFVAAERRRDPSYSLRGRTLVSLRRGMDAWHEDLARSRATDGITFAPSGLRELTLDLGKHGEREIWRVEEIKTGRALREEGMRMNHCVHSYAWAVQAGQTSIWSLTMEDGKGPTGRWAMATVEVSMRERAIVQVRGRYNRRPTVKELGVLARWASSNGCSLARV